MRAKIYRKWTPGEDEAIRHLIAKQKTVFMIAARIKRNIGSVKARADLLGLTIKPHTARRGGWAAKSLKR